MTFSFALAFGTRFLALKKVLIRFGCCAISVQLVAQTGDKRMGRGVSKRGRCKLELLKQRRDEDVN
ncbi:hypothetical protein PAXRUDRAFT_822917 [Paxillus rubicundulus Ve08.2h10]|uniref:Secreted protein n=1 Tax=Paxillus rubicundulus Ve08.2h10 TaxID=930991 RepID=A0A0D0E9C7_9AGAM|nr:hypothetical protein PAXRUDRAFT_822917 [Paxillus rubicundulus Ve08.2h10]